jgi:hypothetical protein
VVLFAGAEIVVPSLPTAVWSQPSVVDLYDGDAGAKTEGDGATATGRPGDGDRLLHHVASRHITCCRQEPSVDTYSSKTVYAFSQLSVYAFVVRVLVI